MKGLIHFYCGDGKGKTTAAAGLAIRAAGQGKKVLFTQFLKDGSSGEITVLSGISGIKVFSQTMHHGFFRTLSAEEKTEARRQWQAYFDKIVSMAGEYDLVVMDEFAAACAIPVIDRKKAADFIKNKPEQMELVLTGRTIPEEIEPFCDYITEAVKRKHPYDKGIPARKGIEF